LPNYVDLAYTYAREADPDTLLFYNDFDVVNNHGKKMGIYDMAKDMQDRGIPIDGIGLQMHLKENKMPTKADIVETI
jgi:endo-1,4-beta-xylanase